MEATKTSGGKDQSVIESSYGFDYFEFYSTTNSYNLK